jgi:hypothetical protein
MLEICEANNWPYPVIAQPLYNWLERACDTMSSIAVDSAGKLGSTICAMHGILSHNAVLYTQRMVSCPNPARPTKPRRDQEVRRRGCVRFYLLSP